jgi:hypothetical protein
VAGLNRDRAIELTDGRLELPLLVERHAPFDVLLGLLVIRVERSLRLRLVAGRQVVTAGAPEKLGNQLIRLRRACAPVLTLHGQVTGRALRRVERFFVALLVHQNARAQQPDVAATRRQRQREVEVLERFVEMLLLEADLPAKRQRGGERSVALDGLAAVLQRQVVALAPQIDRRQRKARVNKAGAPLRGALESEDHGFARLARGVLRLATRACAPIRQRRFDVRAHRANRGVPPRSQPVAGLAEQLHRGEANRLVFLLERGTVRLESSGLVTEKPERIPEPGGGLRMKPAGSALRGLPKEAPGLLGVPSTQLDRPENRQRRVPRGSEPRRLLRILVRRVQLPEAQLRARAAEQRCRLQRVDPERPIERADRPRRVVSALQVAQAHRRHR